MEAPNADGVG